MRRRPMTAGAAVTAALFLLGPGAATSGALEDSGAVAAGSASASSVFVTYYDTDTIFKGGTAPPLDVNVGYSTGDIDRSGTSVALGAVAYSPYVDLPPAVNALGGTNIDFDPVLSRARASVTGQPPKDASASLSTPSDLVEVGTAEAHLREGPVAEAFTTLERIEPAPTTHIKSAASRIKVFKKAGVSVTEATTILRSVSIAGLLTFDSITLTATSSADGSAGDSDGRVLIEGGSVAGTPIALTEAGLQAADQITPIDLAALEESLKSAGIELIGPGQLTKEPGGERAVTVAKGPHIKYTSPNGNTVEIILGRALASSTLLAGFSPPSLPNAPVAPPAAPYVPPADLGGSYTPPPDGPVQQPVAAGPGYVDLSRLVLNDAKSVDAFTALYGALAVGGLLVLAGVAVPRRRSLLEDRFR